MRARRRSQEKAIVMRAASVLQANKELRCLSSDGGDQGMPIDAPFVDFVHCISHDARNPEHCDIAPSGALPHVITPLHKR